jgi:hypothetical protein
MPVIIQPIASALVFSATRGGICLACPQLVETDAAELLPRTSAPFLRLGCFRMALRCTRVSAVYASSLRRELIVPQLRALAGEAVTWARPALHRSKEPCSTHTISRVLPATRGFAVSRLFARLRAVFACRRVGAEVSWRLKHLLTSPNLAIEADDTAKRRKG